MIQLIDTSLQSSDQNLIDKADVNTDLSLELVAIDQKISDFFMAGEAPELSKIISELKQENIIQQIKHIFEFIYSSDNQKDILNELQNILANQITKEGERIIYLMLCHLHHKRLAMSYQDYYKNKSQNLKGAMKFISRLSISNINKKGIAINGNSLLEYLEKHNLIKIASAITPYLKLYLSSVEILGILQNHLNVEQYKYADIILQVQNNLEKYQQHIFIVDLIHILILRNGKSVRLAYNTAQEHCLKNNCHQLSKFLFNNCSQLLDKEVILQAIQEQNFNFIINAIKNDRIMKNKIMQTQIITKIIDLLDSSSTFCYGLHFIYKLKHQSWEKHQLEYLVLKLNHITFDHLNSQAIFCTINPICVWVLIAHIMLIFSRNNRNEHQQYSRIAKQYCDTALKLFIQVENELKLKIILTKIIFPATKPLLDIFFKEKDFFQQFLVSNTVHLVVYQKWTSNIPYSYNIFEISQSFQILSNKNVMKLHKGNQNKVRGKSSLMTSSTSEADLKLSISQNLIKNKKIHYGLNTSIYNCLNHKTAKESSLELDNNYIFQFSIFKHSISFRSIIDFIVYFAIFVYVYTTLLLWVKYSTIFNTMPNSLIQYSFNNQAIIEPYKEESDIGKRQFALYMSNQTNTSAVYVPTVEFLNIYNVTQDFRTNTYVNGFIEQFCYKILNLGTQSQSFVQDNYQSCFGVASWFQNHDLIQRAIYMSNVLVICLGSNSIFLGLYYFLRKRKNYYSVTDLIMIFASCYCMYVYANIDFLNGGQTIEFAKFSISSISYSYAIIIFILWMKFLDFIKMIGQLGIMIKIIQLMIYDLLSFLIILFVDILTFASIIYLLFKEKFQSYGDFTQTCLILLANTLGDISAIFGNDMQSNGLDAIIIKSITVIFVFITNIVLLNLLIAILSNRYSKMVEKSNLEYSMILRDLYEKKVWKAQYGGLMLLTPPLSAINIFIFPIYFLKKSIAVKINNKLTQGFHAIILAIFVVIHTVIIITVFIPLAYMKICYLIVCGQYQIGERQFRIKTQDKIRHLLQWIFSGVFWLIFKHFRYDFITMLVQAYKQIDHIEPLSQFDQSTFDALNKVCAYYMDKNMKQVDVDKFESILNGMNLYFANANGESLGNESIKTKLQQSKMLSKCLEWTNGQVNIEILKSLLQQINERTKTKNQLQILSIVDLSQIAKTLVASKQ